MYRYDFEHAEQPCKYCLQLCSVNISPILLLIIKYRLYMYVRAKRMRAAQFTVHSISNVFFTLNFM